jgi:predicted CopG family antitoxin
MEEKNLKESTIVIEHDTRERLKRLGQKGQTYNQIITKLLDSKSDKIDPLDYGVGALKSSESLSNSQETRKRYP